MLKRIMLFLLAACLPLAAPALAEEESGRRSS